MRQPLWRMRSRGCIEDERGTSMLKGKRIGLGITASHCTYEAIIPVIDSLKDAGATVVPVITHSVLTAATRFGTGEEWIARIEKATGEKVISTIVGAEPFGPKTPVDCMIIAPMTGNSISQICQCSDRFTCINGGKSNIAKWQSSSYWDFDKRCTWFKRDEPNEVTQYEKCFFYSVRTG